MQNYSSKFKITKIILVLFLTFAFSLFTFNYVFAQSPTESPLEVPREKPATGINLSLSPTFLNLRTDPGKEISSSFKVRNNNTFPEYLKLTLAKFETDANGQSVLSDITAEDKFATWIEFEEDEVVVNPQESKTISFTISPPEEASLGYYYAILVSRIQEQEGEGAVISGSTAIPVLLEVEVENAKRELQITSFKPQSLFYEYLPTTFEVTLENTGNVHASPVGDIFIDSMFSKDVAVLPVNPARGNILPSGKRTFTATWDEGFAVRVRKEENGVPVKDEKGNYVYETRYDFSKANMFRFGRYTANLLLVYDNGERDIPLEATVSFWIIPWKILGIGFVVLVLALVGLRSVLLPIWRKLRRRGN
jgi:hypothetical protein